jgi:hypothetical protein
MRGSIAVAVAALALAGCKPSSSAAVDTPGPAPAAPPAATSSAGTWAFDGDTRDAPPAGFTFGRTGRGKAGRWIVQALPDAPSKPHALAQTDADGTDYRFPVAVVDDTNFRDVRLSVACRSVSGSVDQACGLVWRFRDANNYYLTRANALEDNVRLYHVKDGDRVQFASWSGKVLPGIWHTLRVDARGDRFEVYFDEAKVLDAKDTTFTAPGKVGVWTKADSVTVFDDLSATPL